MKHTISRILIILGAALLLVAGGMFTYNQIYDYNAGRRAQELLDQMMAEFEFELPPVTDMAHTLSAVSTDSALQVDAALEVIPPIDTEPPVEDDDLIVDSDPEDEVDVEEESPTASGGNSGGWVAPSYTTIGILSIPKLGLRLAVIGECTDALLGISPCRISGVVDEKPIRLVIVGHRISSHFGALHTLEIGDEIAFTTREGATYYYSATEISDIHQSGGADVLDAVGWDITLITCKVDNTFRTMIRFAELPG